MASLHAYDFVFASTGSNPHDSNFENSVLNAQPANTQPPGLSRASLFHVLPPELMRHIDSYLEPGAFVNWAFSHWPLLQRNELAPVMTQPVFARVIRAPSPGNQLRIPAEIRLEILSNLQRQDQLSYVLADYHSFVAANLAPRPDIGTLVLLRRACR